MFLTAPVQLVGEGQYNLNALTEIEVTDSYLALDAEVRGCQTNESFFNCTTRHYMANILQRCGCIPLNIKLSDEVNIIPKHPKNNFLILLKLCSIPFVK